MENGIENTVQSSDNLQRGTFKLADHEKSIGQLVDERRTVAQELEIYAARLRAIDEKLREAGVRLPGMARVRSKKAVTPRRVRRAAKVEGGGDA